MKSILDSLEFLSNSKKYQSIYFNYIRRNHLSYCAYYHLYFLIGTDYYFHSLNGNWYLIDRSLSNDEYDYYEGYVELDDILNDVDNSIKIQLIYHLDQLRSLRGE